jgi:hypothetical protein
MNDIAPADAMQWEERSQMNAVAKPPLVAAEVNLTDFTYMPLHVRRLLTSDTWIDAIDDPAIGFASMNLWCESWHQLPAASLPDNPRVWQRLSMLSPADWKRVRERVMSRWVKCDDGRLYHPVVAEMARSAWAQKISHREKTRHATEAREKRKREQQEAQRGEREQQRDDDVTKHDVERDEQRDDDVTCTKVREVEVEVEGKGEEGKGEEGKGEEGKGEEGTEHLGGPVVSQPSPQPPLAPDAAKPRRRSRRSSRRKESTPVDLTPTWEAYATAYFERYKVEPVRNDMVNVQLAQVLKRIGRDESPHVAAFYVRHQRREYLLAHHTIAMLLKHAEGLRTEWATDHTMTETEARMADRTANNKGVFERLIAEGRDRNKDDSIDGSAERIDDDGANGQAHPLAERVEDERKAADDEEQRKAAAKKSAYEAEMTAWMVIDDYAPELRARVEAHEMDLSAAREIARQRSDARWKRGSTAERIDDDAAENGKPHPLRRGFAMPAEWLTAAIARGWSREDVQLQREAFCERHWAKGDTMVDWRAAWDSWLATAKSFQRKKRDDGIEF